MTHTQTSSQIPSRTHVPLTPAANELGGKNFASSVIYQVYPKSFYASGGSTYGDLRGIIKKVPYIASLGVDMVWFNPFFASPQNDNGYDISDYYTINPDLGTMEDVEEMIATLAEHGVGVMFDMVLNHVSTEHEWFLCALWLVSASTGTTSTSAPGRYTEAGQLREPTNWESKFGGPCWSRFGEYTDGQGTPLFYMHLYDRTQADLNWYNPVVREELYRVVNFWYDKGVRGFRFDVINVIGKGEELLEAPEGTVDKAQYTDTPIVHTRLQELNRASFGRHADTVTVGEMSSTTIENCVGYSNAANHELDMVCRFHHLKVDYDNGEKWSKVPYRFAELKQILNDWALGMQAGGGWNALFWNNHDQPRALNRFSDVERYRAESATMLATAIHLLRGTPYVYQGEEIGMIDPVYTSIDQYVDVEAHNAYSRLRERGLSEQQALEIVRTKARDNSRVPMQWTADAVTAGFGSESPWLAPAPTRDAATGAGISVEDEERDGVILPYYRNLIALRKQYPVISVGSYAPYALDHEQVFAYLRDLPAADEHPGQHLLVLTNFYGEPTKVEVPAEFVRSGRVLVCNYENSVLGDAASEPEESGYLTLRPYEALALMIEG